MNIYLVSAAALAVLILLYFVVKSRLLKSNESSDIKLAPSRSAPLVKKKASEPTAQPASAPAQPEVKAKAAETQPSTKAEPVISNAPVTAKPTGEQIPEDSILRRHYQSMKAAANSAPTTTAAARSPSIERQATPVAPAPQPAPVRTPTAANSTAAKLPEDSVLRRHFLSQLQSEIASECHLPAPTDSVLLRHHQQLIESKLQARLTAS